MLLEERPLANDNAQCFDIQKCKHSVRGSVEFERPQRVSGPHFGEQSARDELERVKRTKPLSLEEIEAGWVYELSGVDCPSRKRRQGPLKYPGGKARPR